MKYSSKFSMQTGLTWMIAVGALLSSVAAFAQPPAPVDVASATSAPEKGGIVYVDKLEKPDRDKPLSEEDYAGYVFIYFKDQTQSAYMAVSRDGYTFTDLNNGEVIFDGTELAEQKGVRDPHIARGPDGGFYVAMTDLHISAQRLGYRDTQWQRPNPPYGWGNNRAVVMLKSYDLIHWTKSDFRVDLAFPELGDITTAWAPQTVYDPDEEKMMIYFTIRDLDGSAHVYYSYTDDDFTKMETLPKVIYEKGGIDGDVTKVGDKYHFHYVSNARVLHAVSDKINEGYEGDDTRIDPETVSTEAPDVFRRLGTDTWVLMYDVYGARPNNMGFSESTDEFKTYKDIGHFNEGVMKGTNFSRPKHGAISYLTKDELDAITKHWGVELE